MKPKPKYPTDPMPENIVQWLAVNGEQFKILCVCECGRWFSEMDHYAPYHNEMSYCSHCKNYMGGKPIKDGK
jgi:hypothetical protein